MKILTLHFEYDNGIYSLVKLEDYNYIEKYGEGSSKVEIKPKGDKVGQEDKGEQNEGKETNIWLVLYQQGKLLTNNGIRLLTEDDFDKIMDINHLKNSQVDIDIKKTFLVLERGSISNSGYGYITPFYKDGKRSAGIQFSQDDLSKLGKFYVENNRVIYMD